jgi:hypothetical protein
MILSKIVLLILFGGLAVGQGLFLVPSISAEETPKIDLTIYLQSLGWTREQNATYTVDAQVKVYVQYTGTDPPESIALTPSLDLPNPFTDPLYIARKLLVFTGSWVEISSNLWTLQPMLNGSVSFPDYSFRTANLQPWPNDVLQSKVFMAFATTTLSGKAVAGMQTTLNARVISRDVFEKSYYYMLDASSANDTDLTLSQEGKPSLRGHLYNLFLSHGTDLNGFVWVGYIASYYVYILIFITVAVFVLAYKNRLKPFGAIVIGYVAILAAASFQVSPYLSPWSSYVREALSNSIIFLVVFGIAAYASASSIRGRRSRTGPDIALDTKDLILGSVPWGSVSQQHKIEFFNRGNREGQLLNFSIRAEQIPELAIGFSKRSRVQLPISIKPQKYQIFDYFVDFKAKPGFQRPSTIDVTARVDFEVSGKTGRKLHSGTFSIRSR